MKKYLVIITFLVVSVSAQAQGFNAYKFYKKYEDTRGIWFKAAIDDSIATKYNVSIELDPLKSAVLRTYNKRIVMSTLVPFYNDKGLTTISALSLIRTFVEKGKVKTGQKLAPMNLFVIQEEGKLYGIFVYRSNNRWYMHTVDPNDLDKLPINQNNLFLKAGFHIIAAS